MQAPAHVLAAVDSSSAAESVLQEALRIARWSKAKLHVLHVVDRLVVADLQTALRQPAETVRQNVLSNLRGDLEGILKKLGTQGVEVDLKVQEGHAAAGILETAGAIPADLLILGRSKPTGSAVDSATLTLKCIRGGSSRVLVVREGHRGPFRTVVVGVDFSETSREALQEAVRLAKNEKAKLHVVHAFAPPWKVLHYRSPTPEASPAFQREFKKALDQVFQGFVAPQEKDFGAPIERHLVENSRHAVGVLAKAKKLGADLIVVGTHGRSALFQLLLGSTAERIAREATASVLMIRPPAPR